MKHAALHKCGDKNVAKIFKSTYAIKLLTSFVVIMMLLFSHKSIIVTACGLLLCACGGGGSTTSPQTPLLLQNSAPVARAVSSLSIVSEGQEFAINASGSFDVDGDALTFTWSQTSGPFVTLPPVQSAVLDLIAPIVSEDSVVEFQIVVSDGVRSSAVNLIVNIDDLRPIETISKPSLFYNGEALDEIVDLVSSDEGYTVFWHEGFEDDAIATSSQSFSENGEAVGEQIDGEIFVNSNVDHVDIVNILRSGNEIFYNLTVYEPSANSLFPVKSFGATILGVVEGIVTITGREFGLGENSIRAGAASEIGMNKIAVANSFKETDAIRIGVLEDGSEFQTFYDRVEVNIIDNDGTAVPTILSEADWDVKVRPDLTVLNETTYLATWLQIQLSNQSYPNVFGQRAGLDGTLIGDTFKINELDNSRMVSQHVARFDDGNILALWSEITSGNGGDIVVLKGRVLGPQMEFITPEFEIDPDEDADINSFHSTVLSNNQILISWVSNNFIDQDVNEVVKAIAIASDGSFASNEFAIASGEHANDAGRIKSTVLDDQRVVLGWRAEDPDDPGEDVSYTLGFYPLGKRN